MCSGTRLDNKSMTTLVTENRNHGQTPFQSKGQNEQSTQQNTQQNILSRISRQGKLKISSLLGWE